MLVRQYRHPWNHRQCSRTRLWILRGILYRIGPGSFYIAFHWALENIGNVLFYRSGIYCLIVQFTLVCRFQITCLFLLVNFLSFRCSGLPGALSTCGNQRQLPCAAHFFSSAFPNSLPSCHGLGPFFRLNGLEYAITHHWCGLVLFRRCRRSLLTILSDSFYWH